MSRKGDVDEEKRRETTATEKIRNKTPAAIEEAQLFVKIPHTKLATFFLFFHFYVLCYTHLRNVPTYFSSPCNLAPLVLSLCIPFFAFF